MVRGTYYCEFSSSVDPTLAACAIDFDPIGWAQEFYKPEAIICHPRVLGVYFGSSPRQKHVRLVMRGWRLR